MAKPKRNPPHRSPSDISKRVDNAMDKLEEACTPDIMSGPQAMEFYDLVIDRINMNLEALREEYGDAG